ncbi:MAG: FAD-dependent oxidoreductase, partial [Lachnospiraceae bacterium]|nr:FAD-dependent oxidoreductase [Lachnospiraceae bacterium]
ILDADGAALMQAHLEQHGIRFFLKDSVARFEGNVAFMNSGAEVPYDVLVLAVGVRANTGLLREIGGAVNRGILVDGQMRTSVPGIYAAGDCTEGMDLSSGKPRVLAILPNAVLQGYTAGVNMGGGSETYDKGIPMNSIGFFGLHAMTAGTYEGELYEERTEHSLKRLYTRDDRLKGFLLIGCDERAGIYTSMIREQTPLSSVNFELLRQAATTAAFSAEARRKKFGGMV